MYINYCLQYRQITNQIQKKIWDTVKPKYKNFKKQKVRGTKKNRL